MDILQGNQYCSCIHTPQASYVLFILHFYEHSIHDTPRDDNWLLRICKDNPFYLSKSQ